MLSKARIRFEGPHQADKKNIVVFWDSTGTTLNQISFISTQEKLFDSFWSKDFRSFSMAPPLKAGGVGSRIQAWKFRFCVSGCYGGLKGIIQDSKP